MAPDHLRGLLNPQHVVDHEAVTSFYIPILGNPGSKSPHSLFVGYSDCTYTTSTFLSAVGAMALNEITVSINEDESRFEAFGAGALLGYIDYTVDGKVMDLPHTLVFPEFEGQGVGSALVRQTLDMVRAMDSDMRVTPTCPFIDVWIKRHSNYHDLLAG